jgi:hypothetical protein
MVPEKLNFCIITNKQSIFLKENIDYVGFYQWANVFDGQIYRAIDLLPSLKDGQFDIVQIRLCKKNIGLVSNIRNILGLGSRTKIIALLDIPSKYWQEEFGSLKSLSEDILLADFIFATEFTIANDIEDICDRKVFELSHPADIESLKSYHVQKNVNNIAVLYHESFKGYGHLSERLQNSSVKIIVPHKKTNDVKMPSGKNIEIKYCTTQAALLETISGCTAFIAPYEYNNYGKLIIYAATQKCEVYGNCLTDAQRKCYPHTLLENKSNNIIPYINIYEWHTKQEGKEDYILETASNKVELYNWENMKKTYLDYIYSETKEERFSYHNHKDDSPRPITRFFNEIRHVQGKKQIDLAINEFGVVCPVRNGMAHIPEFLRYYRKKGAKHFFFIDNGSTDQTREYLLKNEDVTVYETQLLHKKYESEIRSTIIKEHFRGKWCLGVDVDEFFDYPGSDKIPMHQFLDYLNKNKYTAVLAYLLDMFAKETRFEQITEEDMFSKYCYYDNTTLVKKPYFSRSVVFCNYNKLSNKDLKFYCGGIRKKYFDKRGDAFYLLKHPLIFLDNKIEPFTNPHYSNKAYVADISCVLRHFKFVASFKDKVALLKNAYDYYTQIEYEAYHEVLKNKTGLDLYSKKSRKFENVNQLVKEKFIYVSPQYADYFSLDFKQSRFLQFLRLSRLFQNSIL